MAFSHENVLRSLNLVQITMVPRSTRDVALASPLKTVQPSDTFLDPDGIKAAGFYVEREVADLQIEQHSTGRPDDAVWNNQSGFHFVAKPF